MKSRKTELIFIILIILEKIVRMPEELILFIMCAEIWIVSKIAVNADWLIVKSIVISIFSRLAMNSIVLHMFVITVLKKTVRER